MQGGGGGGNGNAYLYLMSMQVKPECNPDSKMVFGVELMMMIMKNLCWREISHRRIHLFIPWIVMHAKPSYNQQCQTEN